MSQPPTEFDRAYCDLLESASYATPQLNRRTGLKTRALHAVTIRQYGLPVLSVRDINLKWFVAEIVWFLSGSNDPSFMEQFGFKTWSKFANPAGLVPSASGHRWRNAHPLVDQLEAVIDLLKSDPTTRRAVLTSTMPDQDLGPNPPPNVPCLVSWHFTMVDDYLHLSVFQRSCDLWYGLPHDIAGAALILHLLARHLDVRPGATAFLLSNAHLYEDQMASVEKLLQWADDRGPGHCGNGGLYLKPGEDLLPPCMAGAPWVVLEIEQRLARWYDRLKGPKLKGPEIAL